MHVALHARTNFFEASNRFAMFGPNYGAAQSHIQELMKERDDFLEASRAQAARISELEAALASAREAHATSAEQLDVQMLIGEHRASRIDELTNELYTKDQQIQKLREAVRVLWGCFESIRSFSTDGREVLESLDGLLKPGNGGEETETPQKSADR